MLAVATDPDLPIRQTRESGFVQVQEWLPSNQQLQDSCVKTSSALDSASSPIATGATTSCAASATAGRPSIVLVEE
jgi:hypothetical protein